MNQDPTPTQAPNPEPTMREKVLEAIREVYDPEIPVNVHDLGLIYGVELDGENNVKVVMTLTAPSCPAAQELPGEVRVRVSQVEGVKAVEVEITFDPAWNPQMMSEAARLTLGMM